MWNSFEYFLLVSGLHVGVQSEEHIARVITKASVVHHDFIPEGDNLVIAREEY
jgi:uncharacterized radical SAM superfamily protein